MDIKQQLTAAIGQAAARAIADGVFAAAQLPDIALEVPPQKEFGDYATNFAMQSAKAVKKSPRLIAEAIISRLQAPWLEKAVIAGPGFINFYLKSDWLYQELGNILAEGDAFGQSQAGRGQRVQVEFVSANPTGPLHVGHGRGAAVGSALVNLLRAAGYDVEAEFYINDAGTQIDNLAASVNARYFELLGKPAEFPEDGYHGRDIVDTAQRIIDSHGDRYLALSEAERLAAFKQLALAEKLAGLKQDLEQFGVTFDVWFSESTLHQNKAVAETCDLLKANGNIYEKDGALWLRSTAYGDDKDRVVIRDSGVPTYLAADIAYHRDKFSRGFDRIINIWGADHHGYISRVKAAVAAMGYNPDNLEVLILQMVSLYQNGGLVKMSKRTGQGVTLSELVEEVGRDAARFFFIMRSIDSQLDFDLDLAKSSSSDNPVYYIQYAHARICSIFRQVAEAGIDAAAVRSGLEAADKLT
ncbi:MAG: arginine--tRNA ligase, partial [Sporomusa sp.]